MRVLEQLVADGFRYISGNPGTTEQAFMDVLQGYPIGFESMTCALRIRNGVFRRASDYFPKGRHQHNLTEQKSPSTSGAEEPLAACIIR